MILLLALACADSQPASAPPIVDPPLAAPPTAVVAEFPPAAPTPDSSCWAYTGATKADPPTSIDDLDGDGRPEPWREESGCGSSECAGSWAAGGPRAPIVAGEWTGSLGSMIDREPIPAAIAGPERERERRIVEEARRMRVCDAPDPSLAWLLRKQAGDPAVEWFDGEPIAPDLYYVVVADPPEWLQYKGQTLTNTGAGPVQATAIVEISGRRLIRYAHALVLVDTDHHRYAWVWVSAGNQKLRWPTVCDRGDVDGRTARVGLYPDDHGEPPDWLEVDLDSGEVALHERGAAGPRCE